MALVRPALRVEGVRVAAIAAREASRARTFARKHGIPRVHRTYQDLIDDPELDAIYNPLPNGLHHEWSIRALRSGKHVLCEKPLAANATEAAEMADAAADAGRLLVEAFHYRYHPLAARMKALVDAGEIGRIEHIETHFCVPIPNFNDIRFRYDLAGGATMDVGCYAVNLMRFLAGSEPEVVSARARLLRPGVDRWMEATFRFPDGRTGRMTCALLSWHVVRPTCYVRGDRGSLRVINPYLPQLFHMLSVRTEAGVRRERCPSEGSYTHQLRAFVDAARGGTPPLTDPTNAIDNMKVIDAIYGAAGLTPRGTPSR